jgi:hypothetical protein
VFTSIWKHIMTLVSILRLQWLQSPAPPKAVDNLHKFITLHNADNTKASISKRQVQAQVVSHTAISLKVAFRLANEDSGNVFIEKLAPRVFLVRSLAFCIWKFFCTPGLLLRAVMRRLEMK